MKNELSNLIVEYFSAHRPSFYLSQYVQNWVLLKIQRLHNALRSGIVYKYCCAKCASVYYESYISTLHTRTDEHKGISPRTGRSLVRLPQTSIRDYALYCNPVSNLSDFELVACVRYEIPLCITESIFILQKSHKLNDLDSFRLQPFFCHKFPSGFFCT